MLMALKGSHAFGNSSNKETDISELKHTQRQRENGERSRSHVTMPSRNMQCIYHFVDSIALKCALDLGIADIIQARGCPITLSQIANDVASSPSLDIAHLSRLMRFLVHKKLFDATNPQSDSDSEEETLYSLNHCSKWLLRDPQQLSLAPLLCLLQYHPLLIAPYKFLSRSIQEGGNAFHMAHGRELWDFASVDPELNRSSMMA
ncbi:hypothetical protein ACSBR2_027513 [Camellia fascicularis]